MSNKNILQNAYANGITNLVKDPNTKNMSTDDIGKSYNDAITNAFRSIPQEDLKKMETELMKQITSDPDPSGERKAKGLCIYGCGDKATIPNGPCGWRYFGVRPECD